MPVVDVEVDATGLLCTATSTTGGTQQANVLVLEQRPFSSRNYSTLSTQKTGRGRLDSSLFFYCLSCTGPFVHLSQ